MKAKYIPIIIEPALCEGKKHLVRHDHDMDSSLNATSN